MFLNLRIKITQICASAKNDIMKSCKNDLKDNFLSKTFSVPNSIGTPLDVSLLSPSPTLNLSGIRDSYFSLCIRY